MATGPPQGWTALLRVVRPWSNSNIWLITQLNKQQHSIRMVDVLVNLLVLLLLVLRLLVGFGLKHGQRWECKVKPVEPILKKC